MSVAPSVKGWCPGAYRPMESGDGLVVRVRPWQGALSGAQVTALCDLAARFGNGTIDLTSRANLQIRGVRDHAGVLAGLEAAGLLDPDPAREGRRNVLMPPDAAPGDLAHRLHDALAARLMDLPALPAKMGVALDVGATGALHEASADFRFELGDAGLILRADGRALGRAVTERDAIPALIELAEWFVATGGRASGRMARHAAPLPDGWETASPRAPGPLPQPGGAFLGVAFGAMEAGALAALAPHSLRPLTGRLLRVDGLRPDPLPPGFITRADDPLMTTHACPGAPFCASALAPTRPLARRLARPGLHVSGCAKGCAHPAPARLTLTARADGRWDVIRGGAPWDAPSAIFDPEQDADALPV